MARNVTFLKIDPNQFITVGSAVLPELNRVDYSGKVFYQDGFYYLQTKSLHKLFKSRMNSKIQECAQCFTSAEDTKEFNLDIQLIKNLEVV